MQWIAAADYRGVSRSGTAEGPFGQARIDRPGPSLLAGALLESGGDGALWRQGHALLRDALARLAGAVGDMSCLDGPPGAQRLEALRDGLASVLAVHAGAQGRAPRFLAFLAGPRGIAAIRTGPTALILRAGPRDGADYVDLFADDRPADASPELAVRPGPVGFLAARGSVPAGAVVPPASLFDRYVACAPDDRDVHGAIRGWLRADRDAPAAVILAGQRVQRALAG